MTKAGPVYGSFATVAGLFALLYLIGRALVYAAEVAAVRYARLWPRALELTRPTEADTRALTLLAREQERIPAARVEFRLAAPGSPPGPGGTRPLAAAQGKRGYPGVLDLIRCDCGDHLDLDYRQVSPRASADPRAMPMAAGFAARDRRQLGRRRCRWPACKRCQPPAEVLWWRQDAERHPLSPQPGARWAPRSAVPLHDLVCIVVVAQPAGRVPRARTAVLLTGLGAALFGVAALLLKAGAVGWDMSLFRILNRVPAAAASVLTPLSHLFLPAGILAVVVLAVVYVVARNRSVLPVAAGAVAASLAWGLAHVAKAVADRPRPYEVMAGAVLRQQPAHGTSFPSSHTAVTLAVAIALAPFLARPFAAVGIGYAVLVGWSRVYLGVHYPLDVLAGAGIGMAAGGVIVLAAGTLLRRAGRAATSHNAATEVRAPGPGAVEKSGRSRASRGRWRRP